MSDRTTTEAPLLEGLSDENRLRQVAVKNTKFIENEIRNILELELCCLANVSTAICQEVAYHYLKDVHRLASAHPTSGVAITKYIGFLAFWIRKLKPISSAFYIRDVAAENEIFKSGSDSADKYKYPYTKEITDVNERVALLSILRSLALNTHSGHIRYPMSNPTLNQEAAATLATEAYRKYISEIIKDSDRTSVHAGGYVPVLYDMRFRTYGPHHLVSIANQATASARIAIATQDL